LIVGPARLAAVVPFLLSHPAGRSEHKDRSACPAAWVNPEESMATTNEGGGNGGIYAILVIIVILIVGAIVYFGGVFRPADGDIKAEVRVEAPQPPASGSSGS
jgi:hypothetical protein